MTKVTLRLKKILGGKQSLYLDFYPGIINNQTNKITRREFLKMYIIENPKNHKEKQENKETLQKAEYILSTRKIEIANSNFRFLNKSKETDFLNFFKKYIESKTTNTRFYRGSCDYFCKFTNNKFSTSQVNETICNNFRNYLLKQKITQNTARVYYNVFKTVLKQAYKANLINKDVASILDNIKEIETKREYLTLEELQRLADTPPPSELLKSVILFSALTGLRISDIQKLTWEEVRDSEVDGHYIYFRQQKTKGVEMLPISEQARQIMGETKSPTDKVFSGFVHSSYWNLKLKEWVKEAGIDKKITFHCFRHTFATMQLTMGTDIYTVSKLLGHRELKTTQIYANVVNPKKREAIEKIKINL